MTLSLPSLRADILHLDRGRVGNSSVVLFCNELMWVPQTLQNQINLLAMASNLLAMASNLLATASNLLARGPPPY